MKTDPEDVSDALAQWRTRLGDAHVVDRQDVPERSGNATFDLDADVLGRIRPGDRDEVRDALEIASVCGVPVYPISRGKNWGYGQISEGRDGVLIDLRRMNRIVDFDETMGTITVEPGVTYRQVYEYLDRRDSKWMAPSQNGPKSASLIGNRLERGMEPPVPDRVSAKVTDFEVVAPSGEVFHTNRFHDSPATESPVQSVTFGPDLKELFPQSNFGVVTKATFLLQHQPSDVRSVSFTCNSDETFRDVLETLRDLKLEGRPGFFRFGNQYYDWAAINAYEYPWDRADGTTPLPEEIVGERPLWNGSIILRAPEASVGRAHAKRYRDKLKPHVGQVAQLGPLAETSLGVLERTFDWLGIGQETDKVGASALDVELSADSIRTTIATARKLFSFIRQGKSEWIHHKVPWWRKRTSPPRDPADEGDPARDRCGLIWVAPLVPLRAADILRCVDLVRDVALGSDFEPLITIELASERTAIVFHRFLYDRDEPGAEAAAQAAARTLIESLGEEGYYLYRYPVNALPLLPRGDDDWPSVVQTLKARMDPAGILAPGRYDYNATST